MRTRMPFLAVMVMLAALVGLMTAGVVLAAPTTLSATLAGGDAEDPPGDPDGSGTARVTIDPATMEVCWDITTTNIADAAASHIHSGAAGANGPVVVPFTGFSGSTSDCATQEAGTDLQAIIDDPASFYVNVHTADFPDGAVRGQLTAATPNTALPVPVGSPLKSLAIVAMLIGLAVGVRTIRLRG